jgi:hypothetical protein
MYRRAPSSDPRNTSLRSVKSFYYDYTEEFESNLSPNTSPGELSHHWETNRHYIPPSDTRDGWTCNSPYSHQEYERNKCMERKHVSGSKGNASRTRPSMTTCDQQPHDVLNVVDDVSSVAPTNSMNASQGASGGQADASCMACSSDNTKYRRLCEENCWLPMPQQGIQTCPSGLACALEPVDDGPEIKSRIHDDTMTHRIPTLSIYTGYGRCCESRVIVNNPEGDMGARGRAQTRNGNTERSRACNLPSDWRRHRRKHAIFQIRTSSLHCDETGQTCTPVAESTHCAPAVSPVKGVSIRDLRASKSIPKLMKALPPLPNVVDGGSSAPRDTTTYPISFRPLNLAQLSSPSFASPDNHGGKGSGRPVYDSQAYGGSRAGWIYRHTRQPKNGEGHTAHSGHGRVPPPAPEESGDSEIIESLDTACQVTEVTQLRQIDLDIPSTRGFQSSAPWISVDLSGKPLVCKMNSRESGVVRGKFSKCSIEQSRAWQDSRTQAKADGESPERLSDPDLDDCCQKCSCGQADNLEEKLDAASPQAIFDRQGAKSLDVSPLAQHPSRWKTKGLKRKLSTLRMQILGWKPSLADIRCNGWHTGVE